MQAPEFTSQIEKFLSTNSVLNKVPPELVQKLLECTRLSMRELMLALIPVASRFSTPAVSVFKVGAVGRAKSGTLYFGANQEREQALLNNAIHAEQAVVLNALAHREAGLEALAISAPPCGFCRQFLYELVDSEQLVIHLEGKKKSRLKSYLPGAFGPENLNITDRLMGSPLASIKNPEHTYSGVMREAIEAAQYSYAPYTNSMAGIALCLTDGTIVTGFTVENAAFSPTVSPLQNALLQRSLMGRNSIRITNVALVTVQEALVNYQAELDAFLVAENIKTDPEKLVVSREIFH